MCRPEAGDPPPDKHSVLCESLCEIASGNSVPSPPQSRLPPSQSLFAPVPLLRGWLAPVGPLVCPQDPRPARELRQMCERARAVEIVAARFDFHVEEVLPRTPADRPAFQLGEVDVAQ